MSITTAGVKGYEYQYKASVYLGLTIGVDNVHSFLVEKKGSEDIFIRFGKHTDIQTVEVQVKREASVLDIAKLTAWLTHFQESSSSENLLKRLYETDECVLFVTQSRCSDATAFLRATFSVVSPHGSIFFITNDWNELFCGALSAYTDMTVKLKAPRQEFCKKQAALFADKKITAELMRGVLIWDEVSDENLDSRILETLNREYKVPQSQTETVYEKLLEAVRAGRDKGQEIGPMFQDILAQHRAGAPLLDPYYIKRNEEENLFAELRSRSLLLLTGATLCGKSELGRQIAFRFYQKGFNYYKANSLQDVALFFSQNAKEDKVAILEDPWGHVERHSDSINSWKKLESYVSNMSPNHKLIVTTRREILWQIFPGGTPKLRNLGRATWHDLTLKNEALLINYWETISRQKQLPDRIIVAIREHLETADGDKKLQIGQLQFLAGLDLAEFKGKTKEELEHMARMNAEEIGEHLRANSPDIAELMALLSLTATTTVGVGKHELAYILSDDTALYSLNEKSLWTSSFGGAEEAPYPQYGSEYKFSKDSEQHLEYLERRFFIHDEEGAVIFTHPNYFEAGRYLFADHSTFAQKRFLGRLRKALFVVQPDTAFLVASQFSFLAKKLQPKYLPELFELAFFGLDSIYPGVEDRLTVFLVEYIDQLDDDQRTKLIAVLDSGGTPTSHIFWNGQIPHIASHVSRGFRDLFFQMPEEEMQKIERQFEVSEKVGSDVVWKYLRAADNTHRTIPPHVFRKIMEFREVFIRRNAAYLFVTTHSHALTLTDLDLIFSDEHPSVVFEGIRGCFMTWSSFLVTFKENITERLKKLFAVQAVAIRANQLMITFAKDYEGDHIEWRHMSEDQKKDLWNLWGILFPIFISKLPPKVVYLNPGRFGRTMEHAFRYMSYPVGLEVLKAWYQRIHFRIEHGAYPDEYEMSIAHDLMVFTKSDYLNRADLFVALVSYSETNFLLSSLKWLVAHWEDLHETERSKILLLASSDRTDIEWIKAVLLNSYHIPPPEIQQHILGDRDFFAKEPKEIVASFPPTLLLCCLHVYFGHPQPLWWLAVHHHDQEFWGKIVRYILYKKKEPFFELCLRELVTNGVNGFSRDWPDGQRIWRALCRRPGFKNEMVLRLIHETASSSFVIDETKRMWKALIGDYQRLGREKDVVKLIASNIEALQSTSEEKDLLELFDKDFLNQLLNGIQPDGSILTLVEDVINHSSLEEPTIELLTAIRAKYPGLRFFYTSLILDHALKKYPLPKSVKAIIDTIPRHYLTVVQEKLSALETELGENTPPKNWIGST